MPPNSESSTFYDIKIKETLDLKHLKTQWLSIESQIEVPIFLSWAWIKTWIHIYTPCLFVIEAYYHNQLVAIGLITSSIEKRHFVINSRQLRLNQTGLVTQDQIWVEYNDLLCLNEHRTNVVNACFNYLTSHNLFSSHDELIISMMKESRAIELVKSVPRAKILIKRPCYQVDLSSIPKDKKYIDTLKSNTRYQIRRSIRHYEKLHGTISLQAAQSKQEALNFFKQTAPLHIDRWYDSGFKNPEFINFHQKMITDHFDQETIQYIKISAGDTVIAYLYYLVQNKQVFFYLQGILYESDKKLKPGLVAHAYSTQFFIDKGMKLYDYMGGYSQYKTQLAAQSENLVTVQIQKPIFKFILENTAGLIKNKLFRNKHE